jgi:hypothetical protein
MKAGRSSWGSKKLFWPIADFFRERARKGWAPHEISFKRESEFTVAACRWSLICSIEIAFKDAEATVMILSQPRASRRPLTPRSPELKFYDRVQRDLERLGYRGKWDLGMAEFGGISAHFYKRVGSPEDIEREWKVLSGLSFRSP